PPVDWVCTSGQRCNSTIQEDPFLCNCQCTMPPGQRLMYHIEKMIDPYFYQCPESNISATVYYNADNVKTINDDTFIIGSFLLSDMGDIPIEKIVHYELVGKEKILPLILLSSGDNNLITKMVIKK
ncbi:MAG: hypothetical protein ILA13_05095, partial [Eubacterium sp.]|nr:hypothetical protein [Eubacterium sp.]